MRESPPRELIALLERLGLATAGDIRQMGRRVRRLARDLPAFESVWVDALAQARIVTPFQAAEINAGRGESLRVGPYLLCGSLRRPSFAACYRARRVDSGEIVRLVVAEDSSERSAEIVVRLKVLAALSTDLRCEQLAPITETGADGPRIWAASPWVDGWPAAQWLVHNGRFPPEVAIQIARAMLGGLEVLEEAGMCHGDVSAASVMLSKAGRVVLVQPGLRAILRPEEGYAHADLLPEAYDYLAPERITEGTPPTIAGDMYACGCVWWHMLCGRPPLGGGNSLGKLRAAQAAKVFDVRRLAPGVPSELGEAISACLEREPSRRPQSMASLAAMLGAPTRSGRSALSRCMARRRGSPARWPVSAAATGRLGRVPVWLTATAACLVVVATLWALRGSGLPWSRGLEQPVARESQGGSPARKGGVLRTPETSAQPRLAGRGKGARPAGGAVVAAHYEAAAARPATPAAVAEDLVLDSTGPLGIESLRLRAGQCVRGTLGKRPQIMVPRTGLPVDAEDVRFQHVDFVWDHPSQAVDASGGQAAMVHLYAARAEFRGCLFRSVGGLSAPPAAVRWTHPADSKEAELLLPSGRVQLSDCVLQEVGAGVDCQTVGALVVELANVLQLGGGPLVRLDHCPGADEPVLIALAQVTLRGSGPVLECCYGEIEGQPGEITIRAARSAFVPGPHAALLLFGGPDSPQQILRNVRWTGQGSLVSPRTVIAAWRGPDGGQQALDEAAVSIDGLVRSQVGFAGGAGAGAAASRIIRWQAPLQSTDPPGIAPAALPGGQHSPQ